MVNCSVCTKENLLPYLLVRHQLGTINRQLKSSAEIICSYLNVLLTTRKWIYSQLPGRWPTFGVSHCSEILETLPFVNDWKTQFVKYFVCLTSEFWKWFSATFVHIQMLPSVLEEWMQASEIAMLCAYASTISIFETVHFHTTWYEHDVTGVIPTHCNSLSHSQEFNMADTRTIMSVTPCRLTENSEMIMSDRYSTSVGYVIVKCVKSFFSHPFGIYN
jgi:hypothetical protein